MGYIRHHAIIVTSWDKDLLVKAYFKAFEYNNQITPITDGVINGYCSFLIVPDGSKEGWPESDDGDISRKKFIEWLELQKYDDGSSSLSYVEIQFGDDNGVTKIISHN